jgi:two-component system LytT family response regulator
MKTIMDTINAVIVDDEPIARQRIRSSLKKHNNVSIVAECANGEEALDTIAELHPDLLFLDIQMPEISGLDVADQLSGDEMPIIIFVTAYDQYALDAFERHALDYLLKPFDQERFDSALERGIELLEQKKQAELADRLEDAVDEIQKDRGYQSRVMIKKSNSIIFVPVEEIDWIEADGNYVQLHVGDKKHITRCTMTRMERRLDPEHFFRIHRSTIVNINKIETIEPWFHGDYKVILNTGTELTLSRNYKRILKAFN